MSDLSIIIWMLGMISYGVIWGWFLADDRGFRNGWKARGEYESEKSK